MTKFKEVKFVLALPLHFVERVVTLVQLQPFLLRFQPKIEVRLVVHWLVLFVEVPMEL